MIIGVGSFGVRNKVIICSDSSHCHLHPPNIRECTLDPGISHNSSLVETKRPTLL